MSDWSEQEVQMIVISWYEWADGRNVSCEVAGKRVLVGQWI